MLEVELLGFGWADALTIVAALSNAALTAKRIVRFTTISKTPPFSLPARQTDANDNRSYKLSGTRQRSGIFTPDEARQIAVNIA
jgi:hypothetical protein